MLFDYVDVEFVLGNMPTREQIDESLHRALEIGCYTYIEPEGFETHTETTRYSTERTDYDTVRGDTEAAISEIADIGYGTMDFMYGRIDDKDEPLISFWIGFYEEDGDPYPHVVISVDGVYLQSDFDMNSEALVNKRSEFLLTLAKELFRTLGPLHVTGYRDLAGIEDDIGFSELILPELPDVSINPIDWFGIYRPETVERLGMDWLDAVDVWKREQFADGALLVALTQRPDQMVDIDKRLNKIEQSM